jgi:hypothetical protein
MANRAKANHTHGHGGLCSWCDSASATTPLPSAFCWTKMESDAGETLNDIIRRKELERSIGGGVYYWGIGTPIAERTMAELRRRTCQPEAFFSIMRSKPRREDHSPASVLLWTNDIDADGLLKQLPTHALVLSRGETTSGREKRYYALVCHSETALSPSRHASFDLSHFRNLGGAKGEIGSSQVTAVIEHLSGSHLGRHYEISLRTLLRPPYFVKLAGPKRVLDEDRKTILTTAASNPTSEKWRAFVDDIRNRPAYRVLPQGCRLSLDTARSVF